MMEIANSANAKLSFFLDFCEEGSYGQEEITKITKDILERGHDVQTHCHPTMLGKSFWENSNITSNSPKLYDTQTATDVFGKITDIIKATKENLRSELKENFSPLAYRGGSYLYNDKVLKALDDNHHKITSNYSDLTLNSDRYTAFGSKISPFYWSDNLKGKMTLEIPIHANMNILTSISYIDYKGKRHSTENFQEFWSDMNKMPSKFIMIIFHSWSLVCHGDHEWCEEEGDPENDTSYFTHGAQEFIDKKKEAFEGFLKNAPQNFKFISTTEAYEKVKEGEIKITDTVPLSYAEYPKN